MFARKVTCAYIAPINVGSGGVDICVGSPARVFAYVVAPTTGVRP
jgi:hypothetical protein